MREVAHHDGGKGEQVTEADVQRFVIEFLELDGWRHLRTDPVSDRGRGKGFGELGMADSLFIRYGDPKRTSGLIFPLCYQAEAEVLWIEFKRPATKRKPAGKLTPWQLSWHEKERARGALTLRMGMDCEATPEGFQEWYAQSGLAQRVGAAKS